MFGLKMGEDDEVPLDYVTAIKMRKDLVIECKNLKEVTIKSQICEVLQF